MSTETAAMERMQRHLADRQFQQDAILLLMGPAVQVLDWTSPISINTPTGQTRLLVRMCLPRPTTKGSPA